VELPGFTLRYTTDGSEPTVRSPEVRGPIPFRGTVRVAAFNTTGRKGHTARLTNPVGDLINHEGLERKTVEGSTR
jgi:hexosaminidase